MQRVVKTRLDLQADFYEAIELLEINCKTFDCEDFSSAKQISNILHQLVDDRKSSAKLGLGSTFSNITIGVMFGISKDKLGFPVPCAFNLPAYLQEGHMKLAAVATTVTSWLDDPIIRLSSGQALSRRCIIRMVRDQDAGAHSDQSLDSVYVDFKTFYTLNPRSKITIQGKSVDVAPLLKNPALATLRQIAHEFLSTLYSDPQLRPKRNPHCLIYQYGSAGDLEHIRRPRAYRALPIQMPANLLVEH